MPPPPQPSFAPAASSPLKPQRDATSDEMYADASESDEKRSKSSHGSNNSGRGVRMSKSTEFLRNLAGKGKAHAYTELNGEDDDEELLRQPSPVKPKRHSLASLDLNRGSPGLDTARSNWSGSKEALARGFPQPPRGAENPYLSDHGFSSQDSFTTAQGSGGATSPIPPVMRARPWPAQASPQTAGGPQIGDPLVPVEGPHSRSDLFAAETGGMLMFDGETFQKGRGPSAASSQFVRPPASDSHSSDHPSSNSSRLDFTKPRAAPMPDWNEPAPPMSWVAPADWTSEWSQRDAGSRRPTRHARSYSDGIQLLNRQGTLLHPDSSGERLSEELGLMLGKPRNRRLSTGRLLPPPDTSKLKKPEPVRLEASKKRRARVELDVVLERECAVEGGDLRGRLEVVVHGGKRSNTLRVGHGKVRVIGFEEVDGRRHIFYQHQYPLPVFQHWPNGPRTTLFADPPDGEGFCAAKEGTHAIPFSIPLPVGEGAKGTYTSHDPKGPNVRYVVVGSVKIFVPKKDKRAIAHFYRPCVILPYLNPAIVLAPARAPIMTQRTCGLGWSITGEKGKVLMQVALGRRIWVAGQRVWCEVAVKNDSNKKITKCSLAVIQTVNTYLPKKGKQAMSREPTTSHRKKVAEEVVEADFMDLGSGHVTGKGWWTGLEPGEGNRWDLSCPLPSGMLSIPRSCYVEVLFTLRVTLNNSVFVDMPIEAINFLSIDPPPMPGDTRRIGGRLPVVSPIGPASLAAGAASAAGLAGVGAGVGGLGASGESSTLTQMANGNLGTVSSNGGGYDLDQLRGRNSTPDADRISNANPSSTTLHIDTIQQNARLSQQGAAAQTPTQPAIGEVTEVTEDLAPRPGSPDSQYSTRGGTMASKYSVQSVDEDERNLLVSEQARRHGKESIAQKLAIQQLTEEKEKLQRELEAANQRNAERSNLPAGAAAGVVAGGIAGFVAGGAKGDGAPAVEVTPDESDLPTPTASPSRTPSGMLAVPHDDDAESVVSGTYAPSHEPKEVSYQMGSDEDQEFTDAEDDGDTPHGSPSLGSTTFSNSQDSLGSLDNSLPPLQLAPRPLYLSHISEEEEPLDDETLSELMSEDAQHARHIDFGDDDDDLLAEPAFAESTPRRSLEDRLRSACSPMNDPESPSTPRASSQEDHSSMSAGLANLSLRAGSPGARDTFGPPSSGHRSTSSVDYAEPIDVEDISMTDMEEEGYDADAVSSEAHGSVYATSPMVAAFQRHQQTRSLPGSWEPSSSSSWEQAPRRGSRPPALPTLQSARDITWGGVLTGRTVSGRSLKVPFEEEPPLASPSSGTFGTISTGSASNSNGTPSTTRSAHYDHTGHSGIVHDHESRNLAALAEGRDEEELMPPRYGRTDSANTSFHTAGSSPRSPGSGSGSSGERKMPTLAPSTGSSSGSDGESIPSPRQPPETQGPVYALPLPHPPKEAKEKDSDAASIPDRFRPRARVASGDSMESHMSSVSGVSGMSDMLPSVRARIAALETRDTALRSFGPQSAASSTRVITPQSTGLRPTHTGASLASMGSGLRSASPGLRPVSPGGSQLRSRPSTPSEVHLRPISPALTGGSVSSNASSRKRKSYTSTLAPRGSESSQYSMTPNPSQGGHLSVPRDREDRSAYSESESELEPPRPRSFMEEDETPRASHQTTFTQMSVPESESDQRASVLTTGTSSSGSTLRAGGIPPAPIRTSTLSVASAGGIEAPTPPKSPVPRGPRPPLRTQTSKPNMAQSGSQPQPGSAQAQSSSASQAQSGSTSHAHSASIPSGMWLSGSPTTPSGPAAFAQDEDDSPDSRRFSEIHTVHTFSTEATTPRWSGSTRSSPSKKSDGSPTKPSGAFAKLTGRSPRATPKREVSPEPLDSFARSAQGAYALNTARGSRASLAAPISEDNSGRNSPSNSPLASPRIGALGTVGEHRRNSLQQFIRSGPSSTGHGVSYAEGPGYVAEARSPLMVRSATASMEGNIETMSDDEEEVGRELRSAGQRQLHLAIPAQEPRVPSPGDGQPQQLHYDPQTESYVPAPAPAEYAARPRSAGSHSAGSHAPPSPRSPAPPSPRSSGSHAPPSPGRAPPSPRGLGSLLTAPLRYAGSYVPGSPKSGRLSPHDTGNTGHSSDVSSEWSTGYSAVAGRLPRRV